MKFYHKYKLRRLSYGYACATKKAKFRGDFP